MANLFSLNRPYDWAAQQLGIEQGDEDFEFPEAPEVDESPSATTTTLPPVRVPTAEDPLRLVVAGDSTAKALGDALIGATSEMPEVSITNEGTVSTGLARSDYFNWGAEMAEIVGTTSPEVVMFMVGANDGQSILEGDGTVVALFDTPGVDRGLPAAGRGDHGPGRRRRPSHGLGRGAERGDRQHAARGPDRQPARAGGGRHRPWVTYVDVAALLAGPDGGFAEYITLPDGSTARCYAGDGVHLSVKCLDRVMDELVPTLTGLYGSGPLHHDHHGTRGVAGLRRPGGRRSGAQPRPRRIGSCSHTAAIAPSDSAGPNGNRLSPRAIRAIPPMISPSTAPNSSP